jgi:hypothetical protein
MAEEVLPMTTKRTRGKVQLGTQITAELLDEFKQYAKGRGETFSAALERAMRREMAYPPPPVELAPLPTGEAKSEKGRAKKK